MCTDEFTNSFQTRVTFATQRGSSPETDQSDLGRLFTNRRRSVARGLQPLHGSGATVLQAPLVVAMDGSGPPFGTLFGAPPGFDQSPFVPFDASETNEAEARTHHGEFEQAEEVARAAASRPQHFGIGTPTTTDRLLEMLGRSSERQDRMLTMMMERMTLLEQRLLAASSSSSTGPVLGTGIPPPPPPGGPGASAPAPVSSGGGALGDGKLPFGVPMPVAEHKGWKSRYAEVLGYRSWLEGFSSWIALFGEAWTRELKECITLDSAIDIRMLKSEQRLRGLKLLSFIRQAFTGSMKVEGVIGHYVNTVPDGEAHGYEALRLIHRELSLQSRAEVLSFREQTLKFQSRDRNLVDVVRSVDVELHQYDLLLSNWATPTSVPAATAVSTRASLEIPEADRTMILLRSLPEQVRVHVSLFHKSAMEVYKNLKDVLLDYGISTRVMSDHR